MNEPRLHRRLQALALPIFLALVSACGSARGGPTGPLLDLLKPAHGTVALTSFPAFRDGRTIRIYTPAGGAWRAGPVHLLVVLDGQAAFYGSGVLNLQNVADSLTALGRIAPAAIVGIDAGVGELRTTEYTPWPDSFSTLGVGGGGDQFLVAVRDTLLPLVRARLGLRATPGDCALLGFSLGGLMATYAGFAFDSTFTRVAALSPSYWWDLGRIRSVPRQHGRGLLERIYQDTGTVNDNSYLGLQQIAASADSLGFVEGCDLISREINGGSHDFPSWATRMPQVLTFLLEPPDRLPCNAGPVAEAPARSR